MGIAIENSPLLRRKVMRLWPHDGLAKSGKPRGKALTIKRHFICDNVGNETAIELSDGRFEYEWNLWYLLPDGQPNWIQKFCASL